MQTTCVLKIHDSNGTTVTTQKVTRQQNKAPCLHGWYVAAQGSLLTLLEQCQLWNSEVWTSQVSVLHLTDSWARLLEGNTDTPESPTQDCVK